MKRFIHWLEHSFAPKMEVINNFVWIHTLKDSIVQVLPMILIGSLVTIFSIIRDFVPAFPDLSLITNYTMGLIGLFVAFLIPLNHMEKLGYHRMRFAAAMTSVAVFAIVVRMQDLANLDYNVYGAGGMFVAIIVGVATGVVMSRFGKFTFFKEDSLIPDFVRFWFDSLVPIVILVAGAWILVYPLGLDLLGLIGKLFAPLMGFAETLPGFIFINFIQVFIYSMGMSPWMVYPLIQPIYMAGIVANMQAVTAGLPATYICTQEVVSSFLSIGGTGATLPLCMLLLTSRAKRLKAIGTASIVPQVMNINEPVVFGCVAWNPLLMIPMWINGILIPFFSWFSLRLGIANIPSSVFGMWYSPCYVTNLIVSHSVGGIATLLAVSGMCLLVWYPFFKVYEKKVIQEETEWTSN